MRRYCSSSRSRNTTTSHLFWLVKVVHSPQTLHRSSVSIYVKKKEKCLQRCTTLPLSLAMFLHSHFIWWNILQPQLPSKSQRLCNDSSVNVFTLFFLCQMKICGHRLTWPLTHIPYHRSGGRVATATLKQALAVGSQVSLGSWLVKSALSTDIAEHNDKWSTSQLIHAIVVSFFVEHRGCARRRRRAVTLTVSGLQKARWVCSLTQQNEPPVTLLHQCRAHIHTCQLCWHFCEIVGGLSHCLPSRSVWCSQTRTISYTVVVDIFSY